MARVRNRGAYEEAIRRAGRERWQRLTPEQQAAEIDRVMEAAPWEPGVQLAVNLAIRDGGQHPLDRPRLTDAVTVGTTLWLPATSMADIAAGGERLEGVVGWIAGWFGAGLQPHVLDHGLVSLSQRHDLHTWLPLLAEAWKDEGGSE